MSDFSYYPNPTFLHIRDDGEIILEWIDKKGDRLSIYFGEDEEYNIPYMGRWISTYLENGQVVQYEGMLEYNSDLLNVIKEFGLELDKDGI